MHKRTRTKIKELSGDDSFGEIAFFSEGARMATA
jgi:hypothetical protein